MSDEVNFFDLAALLKIKPDTTMEKFGGMLNSSYFDGANIAATLSQKKLINFNTSMPGQSMITLTEEGKQLIDEANTKAQLEFDQLDFATLVQIANGKKTPADIGASVNVRPRDLALHLYKLAQLDYISYEFRSGNVFIMLTEKGFSQVKTGMPKKNAQTQTPEQNQDVAQQNIATAQTAQVSNDVTYIKQDPSQEQAQESTQTNPQAPSVEEINAKIKSSKKMRKMYLLLVILIIILIIAAIFRYIL